MVCCVDERLVAQLRLVLEILCADISKTLTIDRGRHVTSSTRDIYQSMHRNWSLYRIRDNVINKH